MNKRTFIKPVEPDVWIEYFRHPADEPWSFWVQSYIDELGNLTPDKTKVRHRLNGNDQVWEYLM